MDDSRRRSNIDEERKKPYLPFRNYLVFARVMRDPELAKELLERILRIEIDRIEYCNAEQVLGGYVEDRGVRLDLYVRDGPHVFNVEMQCGDYSGMGRRMAYYQARIANDNAPKRGSSGFEGPESYVIFLCADDPFGRGNPLYSFELVCKEADDLVLETGFHWLALNAAAYAEEPDTRLRNVLRYVCTDEVVPDDALVERMDSEVHRINRDEEWMAMALDWLTHEEYAEWCGYLKGEEEGRAEGEAKLSGLISKLLDSDRIDDVKRAATDSVYRESLFSEFGIA